MASTNKSLAQMNKSPNDVGVFGPSMCGKNGFLHFLPAASSQLRQQPLSLGWRQPTPAIAASFAGSRRERSGFDKQILGADKQVYGRGPSD
jgi:hypothetical protein